MGHFVPGRPESEIEIPSLRACERCSMIGVRHLDVTADREGEYADRHWRGVMRSLVAMMMVAAMVMPAAAQLTPNLTGDAVHRKSDAEVREEQEREKEYKAGIRKIPDQKTKVDPWGTVRGSETTQSNQKQQKPGSK
jgi:hypothetical protein